MTYTNDQDFRVALSCLAVMPRAAYHIYESYPLPSYRDGKAERA
jgi:hypothetical protein